TAAVPATNITIFDRICPLDPAATAAIIGIHIATVPLLLINADITVTIIATVTIKRISVFAKKLFPIFFPILSATPVSNNASLTTNIHTTMLHTVELKPEYTADNSMLGIKIPMASAKNMDITLIGNLLNINNMIVILVMIIAI